MTSDPALLSANELLAAYRAKRVSPREAIAACRARIKRFAPLNAFTFENPSLEQEAAASEARWMKGEPAGALDGVPVTFKNLSLTKGWPTERGSKLIDKAGPWTEDAPAVATFKRAAAIILGKTTTPEFGWKAIGDSPLTGITRNPWNKDHTPGGSSAGAAVAAACGIGALHQGTDGGGSIRIPAAFTGIFGIKPTFGRVPAWPPSPFAAVSHTGPMTRSVADAALMLTHMATPDPRDPYAIEHHGEDWLQGLESGIGGLRVAFSPRFNYADVDAEVAEAVAGAVPVLGDAGAIIEAAEPGFANPRDAFIVLWGAGAAKLVKPFSPEQRGLLDPGFRKIAEDGEGLSAVDVIMAEQVRAELAITMNRFFQRFDLLVTPTVAVAALPVGEDKRARDAHWIDWTPFSYPFNMSHHPAATVPCGLTKAGLPIGLQIVGPMFREDLVLRAARAFEARRPWPLPPEVA